MFSISVLEQLVIGYAAAVLAGEKAVPLVREEAAALGLHVMTVQEARRMAMLVGILKTRGRTGTYVPEGGLAAARAYLEERQVAAEGYADALKAALAGQGVRPFAGACMAASPGTAVRLGSAGSAGERGEG